MICRHCGARIERATLYNANPPDGQTRYFADGPSRGCEHEPEEPEEPADPQGWRASLATVTAMRPARVTSLAGSCGEYLLSESE